MKKIIIVAIVVVGVIAGGWFIAKNREMPPKGIMESGEQKAEEFSGTLVQAMKLGVPMKCDWQTNDGSGESYVKGNDVYITTTAQGKTGYMIKKGDCMWSWNDEQTQGLKICQEPEVGEEADEDWTPDSGNFQAEGVDWSIQYKCRPDIFSGDRFEPPAGVEFLDMESMFKNIMPNQ